jgi:mannose-6-phosphate isomerase-like protein (cupin superfamily)
VTRVPDIATLRAGKRPASFKVASWAPASTVLVVDAPGSGPRLHRHPYEEVFVVQEGNATFTAGEETIEVSGGQVVVVPAGVAHKFVNSGAGRVRQVDMHTSDHFVTEWLE